MSTLANNQYFRKWILYFLKKNCEFIVMFLYGDIWALRKYIIEGGKFQKTNKYIHDFFWENRGSFIGLGATFEDTPHFPHGILGIFISNSAHIGKGCTIFQQVTIGSNMTIGSPQNGAPTIGNNVYIGCGAKLIGNIHVGNNARIGANAIVVKDVPDNSITVTKGTVSIVKNEPLDNSFIINPTPIYKKNAKD